MKTIFFATFLLIFSIVLFGAEDILLSHQDLLLRFDPKNGALTEISDRNDIKLTAASRNQYNLQGRDKKWVFPEQGNSFTLKAYRFRDVMNGRELEMELSASGWKLEVVVRLFHGKKVFSRKIAWTKLDDKSFYTNQFRISLDGLCIGAPEDCTVIHPGHWPPSESALTGVSVRKVSSLTRNHMPGAVLYHAKRRTGLSVTMQTIKSDYEIVTHSGRGSVSFQTNFNVRANMKKGDCIDSGEQLISLTKGSLTEAFASLPRAWALNGFQLKSRPAWTNGAVLYSAPVQGSSYSRWNDIETFENFRKGVLPHLKEIGIDILWFQPFNRGRYGVYSYDFEPEVGTESDLRRLCAEAEKSNIRVLMDLIPHGPSTKKIQTNYKNNVIKGKNLGEIIIKEHPEWISRKEDGSFKVWWGGWCMDYANPGWQNEMEKLAAHHIRNCGISGWRVDCARYSPDNERPTGGRIPSQSGTEGAITMMSRVHEAMDRVRKDCILLGETRTTSHLCRMEFIYDTTLGGEIIPKLAEGRPEEWVPKLKLFLERDEASMPLEYASGLMRYSENHDMALSIRRYGSGHRDALISFCFLIPGLPLIHFDQEQGAGILIAKLSAIRKRDEFIHGKAIYGGTESSDPTVLTFIRALPERFSAIAVNFSGRAKKVIFTLPGEFRKTPWPRRELIDGTASAFSDGKLEFEIPPYGTRVFAFSPKENEVKMQAEKTSAPVRGEVLHSAENRDSVMKNEFWEIRFKNGIPTVILDRNGRCSVVSAGYVSKHTDIRDGRKTDFTKVSHLSEKAENGIRTFTGKWMNNGSFRTVCVLNGKEIQLRLENDPAENAAFEIGFGTDADEWFVSALEGALRDRPSAYHPRGDEFALYEKDLWLRKISITHLLQKSGVHWQADAQPLDPVSGQIAVRKGPSWTGIRFTQEDRALLEDLYLRENGSFSCGTTLRLQPVSGTIRMTFRADDFPRYPKGEIAVSGGILRTDGSRHTFINSSYELRVNRNEGGGIRALFTTGKTPLFWNSKIHSDDGFFLVNYDPEFGKRNPTPGTSTNNKESSMRIGTDRDSISLSFGGELKRDARLGLSALPKVAYEMKYRLDGKNRIFFSSSVLPRPRKVPGGSLNWEFQIPKNLKSVRIRSNGKVREILLVPARKDTLLWSVKKPFEGETTVEFCGNRGKVLWSLEKMDLRETASLSIRTTQAGVPLFRAAFFDGENCRKVQRRSFSCEIHVF